MNGDNLFCLGIVGLLLFWSLLSDVIDAWRERGCRG